MTATTVRSRPIAPASRSATPDLAEDQTSGATQAPYVLGDLAPGQASREALLGPAGGDTLPPTIVRTKPNEHASAVSPSDPGHAHVAAHTEYAGADLAADHLDPGHSGYESHRDLAGVNHLGDDHSRCADHSTCVVASSSPETEHPPRPVLEPSPASYSEFALGMAAATLDDIERTRTALNNRVKAMEREGIDHAPEYGTLKAIHDGIARMEHEATLGLQRAMRKHPLGPWVKATVGVGEKQGARLIAAIGDPYWNTLEDRPRRGPAELWAYCGYAPGQKRRKGIKSNWNAQAKMRAFLIAESCIKQMHSPYRADYDRARASWAERDTSDGHKHNHALRVVAKAVLRDLYLAAKEARS